MGQDIIKLTESQLKRIINESIRRVINEWTDVMSFPKEFLAKKDRQWREDRLKKEAEKWPDLDPAGFQWFGNTIRHNGKKKPKNAPRPKVSKPEGMDDITYITQFVPKYNKRFAKGLLTAEEVFKGEEKEIYEPIDVSDFMGAEDAASFADRYYISQYGIVYISNGADTSSCHISIPYFNADRKMYQVNLRIYDENGKELRHTCPSVVGLVRKVFGDKWAERLYEIEREQIKRKEFVTSGDEIDF